MSVSDALRAIALPVETSPVSDEPIARCSTSPEPTGMPSPVITLSMLAGIMSLASSSSSLMIESGVASAGFKIWTLPAASAGPSFQIPIISG